VVIGRSKKGVNGSKGNIENRMKIEAALDTWLDYSLISFNLVKRELECGNLEIYEKKKYGESLWNLLVESSGISKAQRLSGSHTRVISRCWVVLQTQTGPAVVIQDDQQLDTSSTSGVEQSAGNPSARASLLYQPEFMGQTQATKEAIWLRRLLKYVPTAEQIADLHETDLNGFEKG